MTPHLNKLGRRPRPYSLFRRHRLGRRWERMHAGAYTKPTAIRVYQTCLLNGVMDRDYEWQLRPVAR